MQNLQGTTLGHSCPIVFLIYSPKAASHKRPESYNLMWTNCIVKIDILTDFLQKLRFGSVSSAVQLFFLQQRKERLHDRVVAWLPGWGERLLYAI